MVVKMRGWSRSRACLRRRRHWWRVDTRRNEASAVQGSEADAGECGRVLNLAGGSATNAENATTRSRKRALSNGCRLGAFDDGIGRGEEVVRAMSRAWQPSHVVPRSRRVWNGGSKDSRGDSGQSPRPAAVASLQSIVSTHPGGTTGGTGPSPVRGKRLQRHAPSFLSFHSAKWPNRRHDQCIINIP